MYSILRDRQELSIKNNWIDEENRIYLNFSIESLCEILEVSNKTAISLKKELVKYGLLIDKRMGQGKSNRLYVLKPTTTQNKIDNVDITQKCNIYTSRSVESTLQEVKNLHTNDTDFNKTKKEEEERIENARFSPCHGYKGRIIQDNKQ